MDKYVNEQELGKCLNANENTPRAFRCHNCGARYKTGQLLCAECGTRTLEYAHEAERLGIAEALNDRLRPLGEVIAGANEPDQGWLYPELNSQMLAMQKIVTITKHGTCQDKRVNQQIQRLASSFLRRSQAMLMEIALVGTVKAGKSSLINAFIGSDLASVDAVPETSVLTRYRTTASGNYLKLKFYSEKDWKRIWQTANDSIAFREDYDRTKAEEVRQQYLGKRSRIYRFETLEQLQQAVMKWTKSDSKEHFFVKELEVGYQSDAFPHDVFLVDTPGLDDPVKYRSDITRKYISQSDWILACITAESLSEKAELNFLSRVIANRNGNADQIFTVITKKDQLRNTDLAKKTELFLKQSSQLYGNSELAQNNTFQVSAKGHIMLANYLAGKLQDREDMFELQGIAGRAYCLLDELEEKQGQLREYLGVEKLYGYLNEKSVKQARNIIIERIRRDYEKCAKAIQNQAKARQELDREYMQSLIASEDELEERIRETWSAMERLREKQEASQSINLALEDQLNADRR